MKRIIIIISCILSVINGYSQQREYIRLTTDKDCYLAGEEIWLKVCIADEKNQPLDISKVAYMEISDPKQIYAQAKISLNEGMGSGRIQLPRTMHSGTFQLTAYTRYLRNWGEETFTRRLIAVINTLKSSEEDQMNWTDSLGETTQAVSKKISLDRGVYNKRSKVSLTWKNIPTNAFGMSLSVVRKDCALGPISMPIEPAHNDKPITLAWIPESEGHIAQAFVVEGQPELSTARLSVVGKDIRLFEGKQNEKNTYTFYTHGIHNVQEIVLDAVSNDKAQTSRLEILSPFTEKLPERLPAMQLYSSQEALLERSLGMQIQALILDTLPNTQPTVSLLNLKPHISYNLDEWVRFATVRETLIEFVQGIRTTKLNGETVIQTLQENKLQFNNSKALVLIDGVPIENHEQVLEFDARLLHYLHQYLGEYTFGGKIYNGIVSMITHKENLNGLRLEKNATLSSYEFPQKNIVFPERTYENNQQKESRIPDFRHTLYWNPMLNQLSGSIEFYTSDWSGTYVATLKGYTENGTTWEEKVDFIVE